MSADNFVAVFSSFDKLGRPLRWYVSEGIMSGIEDLVIEEGWRKSIINTTPESDSYPTREAAQVAAHDMANKTDILEYGVIEI